MLDRPSTKVPLADQQLMVALYASGRSLQQIARDTFWGRTTVRRTLLMNGVRMRPRSIGSVVRVRNSRDVDSFLKASELYGQGRSLREVGELLGVGRTTVAYRLRAMGTPVRPRGRNLRWQK